MAAKHLVPAEIGAASEIPTPPAIASRRWKHGPQPVLQYGALSSLLAARPRFLMSAENSRLRGVSSRSLQGGRVVTAACYALDSKADLPHSQSEYVHAHISRDTYAHSPCARHRHDFNWLDPI